MIEKVLESGAKLKIDLAPFEDSHELWEALLAEGASLQMHGNDELSINIFKDAICKSLSSKRAIKAVRKCMERSMVDGLKCTMEIFEDEKRREDYLEICYEVAKANVYPFVKRLYAKYAPMWEQLKEALK